VEIKHCVTCNATLFGPNYIAFPCPNCGEIIYRCKKCRQLGNHYVCSCGFEGP